jgi:ribokinase
LNTYAEVLPKLGQTVFGTSFQQSFGGKGANQVVQCARLGLKTAIVGCLGEDSHGEEYIEQLQAENIITDGIVRASKVRTGTAIIQIDARGQNTIIIVQGANLELLPDKVSEAESLIGQAKVVLLQNEIPIESTRRALELCRKHNTISILNPAPASEHLLELVPLCDIFCPNETELAALADLPTDTEEEIQAAGDKLLQMGCKIVVVTMGARGACVVDNNGCKFYPTIHKVNAVDTVGAGDSFIGECSGIMCARVICFSFYGAICNG